MSQSEETGHNSSFKGNDSLKHHANYKYLEMKIDDGRRDSGKYI